jgi:hypothetical protein
MIDCAEGQLCGLAIKKRLQLISVEVAESPFLELSQQVELDSILRGHSCRAFPLPFIKRKEDAINKIAEGPIGIGIGAGIDGAEDASELFLRLRLRHFRSSSELLCPPLSVLPPTPDPRSVKLHHITFLKPFPH